MSQKRVKQIATVAKLSFDEAQLAQMTESFDDMLAMIETLKEVDTEGVVGTYRAAPVQDVYRADQPVVSEHREALLNNAPSTEDGYIEVPVIIESEEV